MNKSDQLQDPAVELASVDDIITKLAYHSDGREKSADEISELTADQRRSLDQARARRDILEPMVENNLLRAEQSPDETVQFVLPPRPAPEVIDALEETESTHQWDAKMLAAVLEEDGLSIEDRRSIKEAFKDTNRVAEFLDNKRPSDIFLRNVATTDAPQKREIKIKGIRERLDAIQQEAVKTKFQKAG